MFAHNRVIAKREWYEIVFKQRIAFIGIVQDLVPAFNNEADRNGVERSDKNNA